MIDLITDFEGLQRHLDESSLSFKESIVDFYRIQGENQDLNPVTNASVVRYAMDYGRVPLVWSKPAVSFSMEFARLEDIYKHLFLNYLLEPETMVLLLDSKSRCSPESVRQILTNTPLFSKLKENALILDLGENRVAYS